MRYRTIVADPPWPYPEGFATQVNHEIAGRRRAASERGLVCHDRPLPYASLTVDDIAALPVREMAAADARCFLWAPNRHLPAALNVLGCWGFKYRQLLVWDKTPNYPRLGGSVAPNAAEFLIVGVVGRPPRVGFAPSSILRARKPRTVHSRKPDAFIDLVECVSPGPYAELFARRARLGWDYPMGDQALGGAAVA